LETLGRVLGHAFQRPELLQTALTHRSFDKDNNERLEFLGDAILNYLMAEALYQRFPTASEGELSRLRASVVKGATLAELAAGLQLGQYLRLGPGELKSGGFRRESILADALEAIIGALYLDGGPQACRERVLSWFDVRLSALSLRGTLKDPKTRLQEQLQGRGLALPTYEVLQVDGEHHAQTFLVACHVEALGLHTRGNGSSRRRAEQEAAREALKAGGYE
jgi:ribonuclease-3